MWSQSDKYRLCSSSFEHKLRDGILQTVEISLKHCKLVWLNMIESFFEIKNKEK